MQKVTQRHTHSWPAELSGSVSFIQRCQASCARREGVKCVYVCVCVWLLTCNRGSRTNRQMERSPLISVWGACFVKVCGVLCSWVCARAVWNNSQCKHATESSILAGSLFWTAGDVTVVSTHGALLQSPGHESSSAWQIGDHSPVCLSHHMHTNTGCLFTRTHVITHLGSVLLSPGWLSVMNMLWLNDGWARPVLNMPSCSIPQCTALIWF